MNERVQAVYSCICMHKPACVMPVHRFVHVREEEEVSSTQWYPGRLFCSSRDVWEDTLEWVMWDHGYSGN